MTANLAPTLWVRVYSFTLQVISCIAGVRAGHWLFTKLLLSVLFAATDASSTREKARVVTVSSFANYLAKEIDFEAIADGPTRRKIPVWELYNRSKLVRVDDDFFPHLVADHLAGGRGL